MKTVNDFKVVDGVAVLEGVAYAEEAKVVEEYLKSNTNQEYVSVVTKDKRNFVLAKGKLVSTKESKFLNPYYSGEDCIPQKQIGTNELETKIEALETRILLLEDSLIEISKVICKNSSKRANCVN